MAPSYSHVAVVLLLAGASFAQRGNYLEDDFDLQLPARPAYRAPARPQVSSAPAAPRPTPVPIIKQIDRHNEDGSYTYGYEGADGSFKIETKLTTGEVMGKYGYVDDTGKVRVVEYGANKFGFQPAGEGITVAPPTLVDETTSKEALREQQASRLYLEDDRARYYEEERPARPVFVPEARPAPRPAPRPQPSYKPAAAPAQHAYRAPPQPAYRPQQAAAGPVPQRAVVTGAAPAAARPAPVYEEPRPQPAHRSAAPAYRPPPQQVAPARPQSYAKAAAAPSILDQLERDYALPSSGSAQPYHDISFGSF